jgi:hypothetical protein
VRVPLSPATAPFGATGTAHLLALGVVGLVVFGTLYHVVPFVVLVHRYSDHLGRRELPMIDDLYDDRLAAADFVLLSGGSVTLAEWFPLPAVGDPGGLLVVVGVFSFSPTCSSSFAGTVRTHCSASCSAPARASRTSIR